MAYTKADLKHDLAAMGLTGNETILIHSSMKSIGPVEGGADTVLDALMEFFAEGLLLLPTHTWRFINEENRVFDVRRSPCCVGILPELFRQRPGVVRSLHPTHSMAAYGKDAAAYLEGELDANTPCTPGGCYDRLRAAHGKVLLLGVTHARNTFIHSVEEVLNVPNRLTDKPLQLTVVDEAGAQHTVYMRRHYNAQQPHLGGFCQAGAGVSGLRRSPEYKIWRCKLRFVRRRGAFPGHTTRSCPEPRGLCHRAGYPAGALARPLHR